MTKDKGQRTNPLRIIIADDEAVIRMGLKTMARSLGHKVVATTRTGAEAIEKVRQLQPDLLLLDIKMPEMDGLAAARKLNDEAPLPIVMLTAYSEKDLVEQAVEALVMGYLVKPIDEAKLAPSIDMAVARFKDLAATSAEAVQLKERLSARDIVDEARNLLMSQGLSENEAYHQLQSTARRRQITLAEMAERVIKNDKGTRGQGDSRLTRLLLVS